MIRGGPDTVAPAPDVDGVEAAEEGRLEVEAEKAAGGGPGGAPGTAAITLPICRVDPLSSELFAATGRERERGGRAKVGEIQG